MADFFIITNNEMVRDKYADQAQVEFQAVHYTEIMRMARDYIHSGHKLLTHPLAGSIKPNETPYKTIFLTKSKKGMDAESLRIIEECVIACKKFGKDRFPNMPEQMRQDFRATTPWPRLSSCRAAGERAFPIRSVFLRTFKKMIYI